MTPDTPPINVLKGQELKRLRKSRGWTQEDVGKKLGGAGKGDATRRETVLRWESGEWPDAVTERALASVFNLPVTYFDDAVRAVLAHDAGAGTDSEIAPAVVQLDQLFTMDPRQSTGPWTVQEIKEHLSRQIEFFFRQAMPDGEVTLEGVERARTLLRAAVPKKRKK